MPTWARYASAAVSTALASALHASIALAAVAFRVYCRGRRSGLDTNDLGASGQQPYRGTTVAVRASSATSAPPHRHLAAAAGRRTTVDVRSMRCLHPAYRPSDPPEHRTPRDQVCRNDTTVRVEAPWRDRPRSRGLDRFSHPLERPGPGGDDGQPGFGGQLAGIQQRAFPVLLVAVGETDDEPHQAIVVALGEVAGDLLDVSSSRQLSPVGVGTRVQVL